MLVKELSTQISGESVGCVVGRLDILSPKTSVPEILSQVQVIDYEMLILKCRVRDRRSNMIFTSVEVPRTFVGLAEVSYLLILTSSRW